jgi:hypothetical protein
MQKWTLQRLVPSELRGLQKAGWNAKMSVLEMNIYLVITSEIQNDLINTVKLQHKVVFIYSTPYVFQSQMALIRNVILCNTFNTVIQDFNLTVYMKLF